ncbi:TonB-dependent receptor plug domain-containing protein [Albimonas pacifica]|uniref:Vitamin B12 transporter n=1 Tax=Albimonas pacifica TaxID=1114924 RepID=A0A1I3FSR8_9RHOB|nr:TonB-dependent receptor [Albimonas pacifica]SFI13971.1 vitamin B12 transporter [Albimonas pacifica]
MPHDAVPPVPAAPRRRRRPRRALSRALAGALFPALVRAVVPALPAAGLVAAAPAGAQVLTGLDPAEPDAPVRLEAVRVQSASRAGLPASAVGSAVTVVTRAQIERRQSRTVAEVLQDVPGVEIAQTRPGAWTPVSIRGSDGDQVLVLIDGMELGDPSSTSTAYQFDHLASLDIERIEVLRGNQSSLYGSDAIGGVINIVTRHAPRDGTLATVEVEAGPYGTVDGGASLHYGSDRADLRLTAFGRRFDGPSIVDPRTATGPADEDDAYAAKGLSGRAVLRLTDAAELSLGGFWSLTRLDYDDATQDSFDDVDKDEYALGGRLTWEMLEGRLTHQASASVYNARREYHTAWSRPAGDVYDGTKTNLGYTLALRPVEQATLVAGVDLERERTDQHTAYTGGFGAEIATDSLFGELALEPLEGLTLTGAGRLDDNSRFGTFATWRATAAWFTPLTEALDGKLRASWGTGAKAPGLYQLFDPTYGDRRLEVEESRGWDIGLDLHWAGQGLALEATYFRNRVENEIGFGTRADGGAGYVQFGETRIEGVETGLSWAPLDWLEASQSYTWLLSRDGVTGAWRGRSRHRGTTAATVFPHADVSLTAVARYASGDAVSAAGRVPGYVVFDLAAAWRATEEVELFGRVENLFDRRYQESYGRATPGFGVYAGVRAAFGSR